MFWSRNLGCRKNYNCLNRSKIKQKTSCLFKMGTANLSFILNSQKKCFYQPFQPILLRSVSSFLNWQPKETETHTGQKWAEDDYRLARFMDKPKQVNPNWAIKLIAEVPPIPVEERVTCCDGGSGPTGHPKVYINLDKPGCHSCLYCGLRYFRSKK